jgi:hypothetical protein
LDGVVAGCDRAAHTVEQMLRSPAWLRMPCRSNRPHWSSRPC